MFKSLKRSIFTAALFLLGQSATGPSFSSPSLSDRGRETLTEAWTLKGVFTQPESAAYDPGSDSIFISNVNGYAEDGNGFVSRVTSDGSQLELKWLDGLNSPTGLMVHGDTLYVVDFDRLLKINIESGKLIAEFGAPDELPALNDVAVSPSGEVFVTGSASSAIYQLQKDKLVVWLKDSDSLKFANGLYIEEEFLVFGGEQLLTIDLNTKKISEFSSEGDLELIKDIDGIAKSACGDYWLTLIDDPRTWAVSGHIVKPLSEDALQGIDISIYESRAYVPRVGGSLSVFDIDSASCH